MTEGLSAQVSRGAIWTIASRAVDTGIGMISMIILARLLTPEDFGLLGIVTALVVILALLRTFSFDIILIQRQDAGRAEYDTAWTFNVIFGAVIAAGLLSASSPLATVFKDERLIGIASALALAKLIEGFENVGTINFRKDLELFKEFRFVLLRRSATFVITIGLALAYRNYWALVLGIVSGHMVSLTLSYVLSPYRPRFSTKAWRELFAFSKWNAINGVVYAVYQRSADFLIAKLAGPAALGIFSVAQEIALLPSQALGQPINRAVYPGYARAADDPARLRAALYRVLGLVALIVLPAGVGIAATADSLVPLLLGEQWLNAIPLVAILVIRGTLHGILSNVNYVYLALGKPKLATIPLVVQTALLLPALWFGLQRFGVLGAAYALIAAMVLEIPLHLAIARWQLQVRPSPLLRSLWRPATAVALMAIPVRWISAAWIAPESTGEALLRVACLVATGALSYAGCVAGLWWISGRPPGAEETVVHAVTTRISIWRRTARSSMSGGT